MEEQARNGDIGHMQKDFDSLKSLSARLYGEIEEMLDKESNRSF
jgi:hypothetical protein